ncbi:MAG: transposase [Candidatus Nitrosotenuis sp.]
MRGRGHDLLQSADRAYDSDKIRRYLALRGIRPRIPRRIWKGKKGKKKTGTRYTRVRSSVERFFAWLKCGFRRVSVRYERLDAAYTGFLNLASFLIC